MKRFVSLMLAMLMLLPLCSAAMAESQPEGIYSYTFTTEEEGGKTTDTFTIWVSWSKDCPDETNLQKVMRETLGIDYKCEYMQSNDALTTLNLRLASKAELPDMMLFGNNPEIKSTLIGSGRVMLLNDILQSDNLPNLGNMPEWVLDTARDENGDIWYVPSRYALERDNPWPGWTIDAWYARTDLMEQAGVTEESMSTLEGFEDALRKFKQLKTADGQEIIPLSFVLRDIRVILATFGMDAFTDTNGFPAVQIADDGSFEFYYDSPKYKDALAWINKMYREGLIDIEVCTQQNARYSEKIKNGQVAVFASDFWTADPYNASLGSFAPSYSFKPIQSPVVEGVTKGHTSYVDPNPQAMVFINKDTKHLNAVLNFLDWCNEPSPYREQENNEGPLGTTWFFLDDTNTTWDFTPEYGAIRNSGAAGATDQCTPQLFQLTPYSNKWYAWFTNYTAPLKAGDPPLTSETCHYVGANIQNHRALENRDNVQMPTESLFSMNMSAVDALQEEYTAKMIMADSDEAFIKAYETFIKQLEIRCDWSEMKKEWLECYNAQYGE